VVDGIRFGITRRCSNNCPVGSRPGRHPDRAVGIGLTQTMAWHTANPVCAGMMLLADVCSFLSERLDSHPLRF